jgi:hypothetical protein
MHELRINDHVIVVSWSRHGVTPIIREGDVVGLSQGQVHVRFGTSIPREYPVAEVFSSGSDAAEFIRIEAQRRIDELQQLIRDPLSKMRTKDEQ